MSKLDIEDIWRSQPEEQTTLADEELEQIMKSKSLGIHEKFKRSAKTEHTLNMVVGSVLVIVLFVRESWVLGVLSSAFFLGLVLYYYQLYRQIWELKPTSDVRDYLIELYHTMKVFMRRYYIGMIIIFPVSVYLGLQLGTQDEVDYEKFKDPQTLLLLLGLACGTGALVYWIFQKMYGNAYKRLKEMVKNLEE